MSWLILVIAALFEIAWAIGLKSSAKMETAYLSLCR